MVANILLPAVVLLCLGTLGVKADVPDLVDQLMTRVAESSNSSGSKITVVGAGQVGMASVISLLTKYITDEIALVDINENKLKGEMMDLQHGSVFIRSPKIEASTDYAVTANSKICIVTAGVRQTPGESRLDLVQRNVKVFQSIIPKLVQHSPNTILLIVSNPVDIMTYVAWKLSKLPKHRVIGSGTNLDSARLRFLLSQQLDVSADSVHGWIIGEHGDSSVAVWSEANAAGVRLRDLDSNIGTCNKDDCLSTIHEQVVRSAYEVIRLKGYTSWAIGLSVADICQAILRNTHSIHAVSTAVKGLHGISHDLFLSLPCVMGGNGVSHVINQLLSKDELKRFYESAETINKIISGVAL